ncbi:MAG: hypothetical protein ACRYF0_09795 [Janthinobacterium lividum]
MPTCLACRLLAGLVLSMPLAGCVTSSLVRPGFKLPLAQDLAFVSPVTTVAVSRNFWPATADKAATLESARLLRLALLQHRAELRLRNEVTIPDSLLLQARQEIYQAVLGIEAHWQLASGANMPVLNYLLSQQRQRYALLTVASGLTFIPKRPPPVLAGQPRLGGSGGSASPTLAGQPKSNIFLLIYDQQRQAIVYYRHTPPLATNEPLAAASLEQDFAKLLKQDFRPAEAMK